MHIRVLHPEEKCPPAVQLCGDTVPQSNKVKYLGLLFDQLVAAFRLHITSVINSCRT